MAPAGTNGSIVGLAVSECAAGTLIPGRSSGTLGEGTITAASLVGPLAGQRRWSRS